MKSHYLIATIVRLANQIIVENIILYNSKILITISGNHQLLKEQILSIPEHISNSLQTPANNKGLAQKRFSGIIDLENEHVLSHDFRRLQKSEMLFWVWIIAELTSCPICWDLHTLVQLVNNSNYSNRNYI